MPPIIHFELSSLAEWVSGLSTAAVLIWTIFETRKYTVPTAEVFTTELYSSHGPNPTFGIINHGRVTIGITGFQLIRTSDSSTIYHNSFNNPPVQAVRPEEIFTHTIPNQGFRHRCTQFHINKETELQYIFIGTGKRKYKGFVKLDPNISIISV